MFVFCVGSDNLLREIYAYLAAPTIWECWKIIQEFRTVYSTNIHRVALQ